MRRWLFCEQFYAGLSPVISTKIFFEIKEREFVFPSKEKYHCSRSCANSKTHSEKTKRKISKSLIGNIPWNKETFTKKYCNNCNKEIKFNKSGLCRKCYNEFKRKNMSELSKYRGDCSFKFNLSDYPDRFDFFLIEKYGWYMAKNHGNNLNGVSRDHIVSVKFGFENRISPEIISHPANCQLLRHNDNVSKNSKCGMTVEELQKKIKNW